MGWDREGLGLRKEGRDSYVALRIFVCLAAKQKSLSQGIFKSIKNW